MRKAMLVALLMAFCMSSAVSVRAAVNGVPAAATAPLCKSTIQAYDLPVWQYHYTGRYWSRLPLGTPIWRDRNGSPVSVIGCKNPITFVCPMRVEERIVEKPVVVEKRVEVEKPVYYALQVTPQPMYAVVGPQQPYTTSYFQQGSVGFCYSNVDSTGNGAAAAASTSAAAQGSVTPSSAQHGESSGGSSAGSGPGGG